MNLSKVIFVAVVCAALGFGQAAQDQKPSGEKVAKPDTKKPAAAEKPEPGGKSEGIKVHGHWMLEVRNPDGTLASRKEFENSLITSGDGNGSRALTAVLAGGAAVAGWYVELQLAAPGNPSCTSTSPCQAIVIAQAAATCGLTSALSCSPSLTAVVGGTGAQLILQGTSAAVGSAGTIPSVYTALITCNPGLTPAACQAGGAGYTQWAFTSATQTLSVQAGQTITATVTFSFS